MTTRSIVLAVNVDTIGHVAELLRQQNLQLGLVAVKEGELRCADITPIRPKPVPLSDRDLVILRAYAEGMSHKQVGTLLGKTESAAKSYSKPLFRKLDAKDRAEAVAIAYRMGLLDQEVAA